MKMKLTMLAGTMAALLTACSTSNPQLWTGAPPNIRAQMGTVGVRLDSVPARDFVFDEPESKSRSTRDKAGQAMCLNLEGAAG